MYYCQPVAPDDAYDDGYPEDESPFEDYDPEPNPDLIDESEVLR